MRASWRALVKNLWVNNPLFIAALGNCPALAVTTSMDASIGMGVASAFVILFTNLVVSAIRNYVPSIVRIAVFVAIGATFVTFIDLFFHAYVPTIWLLLGIYLPLITTN